MLDFVPREDNMKEECCKDCKHLKALWYWEDYPHNKKEGYCCDLLLSIGGETVMQIYNLEGLCECYSKK